MTADAAKTGHELLPTTTTTICPGSPHAAQVRTWFSAGPVQLSAADVGTDVSSVPLGVALGASAGPDEHAASATATRSAAPV